MTQQIINRGSIAGDNTGDNLFTGAGKINDNFTEIYSYLANPAQIQATSKIIDLLSRSDLINVTSNTLGSTNTTGLIIHTKQYYDVNNTCPIVDQYWRWSNTNDSVVSTVTADSSLGGYWVQFFPQNYLTPLHFGAKGDYNTTSYNVSTSTNDRTYVKYAMDRSATLNIPVLIDRGYFIDVNSYSDITQILANTKIVGTESGALVWDHSSCGLFYSNGANNISFINVNIQYAGTRDIDSAYASNQSGHNSFYTAIGRSAGASTINSGQGSDTLHSALAFMGGYNIKIQNSKFSISPSANTNRACMGNGIWFTDANDGSKGSIEVDHCVFDGCLMGFLGHSVGTVYFNNNICTRYGSLTDTINGYPPPHFLYISGQKPSNVANLFNNDLLVAMNNYDASVSMEANTSYSTSYKPLSFQKIIGTNNNGYRPSGYGDFSSQGGYWKNFNWKGSLAKSILGGGRPIRFIWVNGDNNSKQMQNFAFEDGVLEFTDDITDGIFSSTGSLADSVYNCSVKLKIIAPNFNNGSSSLFALTGSLNKVELDYISTNASLDSTADVLFTVTGGGCYNDVTVRTWGIDYTKPRLVEQVKSSVGNTFRYFDATSGNEQIIYSSGASIRKINKTTEQTVSTGNSYTLTGFIPAGVNKLHVGGCIKSNLTTSNSVTGFTLGTAGDTDMYGSVAYTNSGSTSSFTSNWTANPTNMRNPSAEDVVITATGGTFAGGIIEVYAIYEDYPKHYDVSDG